MPRTVTSQMREVVVINMTTDSPFGEFSLTRNLVPIATVRAKVVNISGSAFRHGVALDANITHSVEIRNTRTAFELTTENLLTWRGFYLRVRQVRPVGSTSKDPREQFLLMLCEMEGEAEAFKDPSPENRWNDGDIWDDTKTWYDGAAV